jgi:hypothetical protein
MLSLKVTADANQLFWLVAHLGGASGWGADFVSRIIKANAAGERPTLPSTTGTHSIKASRANFE